MVQGRANVEPAETGAAAPSETVREAVTMALYVCLVLTAEFVAAAREREESPAPAQRQASLRRSSEAPTTVVAPAPPSAPQPSLLTELVEVVRDLVADVRRALLEVLSVALDVLREQLTARCPRLSRGATTGGDGRA